MRYTHKLQNKTWLQFSIPVMLAAAVTWLTLHPFFEVSYRTPFLLYFAVIFMSAAYGGSLSSIVATLSCVLFSFIFVLPEYSPNASFFGIATCIFLAEGLLLSALFHNIEKIQEKLLSSERRFRGIVEKSAEGILMTDKDGRMEYLSPSAAGLLGRNADLLSGEMIQSLIHPDQHTEFEEQFASLINNEVSELEFLKQIKAKGDRWIWIEGTIMDLRQEKAIRSFVFQFRDVTSRIELEMQKEDFVQITSHELKTPVTSIKGFIQVLKKKHHKEQRDQDLFLIEHIENQSEKLIKLIEDLLDITRIKNGELPYKFSVVDITECISEIITAYQAIHPSYAFEFSFREPSYIYADKERIGQVIANLLNNAIRYSPGKTRLKISVNSENGKIKVSVRDFGIGIPKDQQEKIFERFYRVPNLSHNTTKGLGIGLYISSEIIKRHGGEIGLDSELGDGSEFWIKLNTNS